MSISMKLFICIAICFASALADCAVVPSTATDETWCSNCNTGMTRTNAVCAYCSPTSPYSIFAGMFCSEYDCNNTPATYTSNYCSTCGQMGDDYFLSPDGSGCISQNCSSQPEEVDYSWCSTCTTGTSYPNYNASECIDLDCTEITDDGPLTDEKCALCFGPLYILSSAESECVEVNCDVAPTGAYTDDWCNSCNPSGKTALADKSACVSAASSATDTTTNNTATTTTTTNGSILSIISSILLIAASL